MKRGVFLAVALVFGLLAFFWLRRSDALRRDVLHAYDHPVLVDLQAERVTTIRIDRLALGIQIQLERDRAGSWFVTDPIAYPAEGALVEKLLAILARERGTLDPRPVLAELGLDPPQAVLELDELDAAGVRTTRRVEIGAPDVDPRLVTVRVPGHPMAPGEAPAGAPAGERAAVLRVSRALSNTLERNPDDFRDTRLTPLSAGDVRRLVRRGAQPLDALRVDAGWLAATTGIRLDPGALGLVVRCAAEMRVRAFADDAPASLAGYGLERPELELQLFDRRDQAITLFFARSSASRWYAKRADLPNVFEVEGTDMGLLQRPEATLWDQTLVRLLRERLVRVELASEQGEVLLERAADGWTLRVGDVEFPADEARVDDLVAGLEQARVAVFVPGLELPAGERSAGFALLLDDGSRQGADLGPLWSDPAKGIAGRKVRRLGESACGLVDESLLALVSTRPDTLRSRRAHLVPERLVERVELRRGGDRQLYVRSGTRWRPHGLELEASEDFLRLLDPLLALRVERWLAPQEAAGFEPAVEVDLSGSFGAPLRFALGRTAAGDPACRLESGAAGTLRPELLAGVLGLFEP